jgi:putative heme transporter
VIVAKNRRPIPGSPGMRAVVVTAALLAVAIAVLYVLVPAIAGLEDTWSRISTGDPIWLLVAAALEILSYLSYMALIHATFAPASVPVGWAASYRITMVGVVASRLFALAGAGGIAVTAWALRRLGMRGREVVARMAAFFMLLYGVFMAGMVAGGLGLWTGLLSGPAPFGLTIVPAIFGAGVIAAVLVIAAISDPLEAALDRHSGTGSSGANRARKAAVAVPATVSSGVRTAIDLIRSPRPGLLGGAGWFAFDIAVLWASLAAFGATPPAGVLVMGYFVGMAANALPIPGGIGVVEGGMVGALVAFGVEAGPAIVGVLSYRAFAFWLPMIPGLVAYLRLLRTSPAVSADYPDRHR